MPTHIVTVDGTPILQRRMIDSVLISNIPIVLEYDDYEAAKARYYQLIKESPFKRISLSTCQHFYNGEEK